MKCHETGQQSARPKSPLEIRSGNTRLKIYRGRSVKDGKAYPLFTLCYYEDGRRKRSTFADLDEAKTEADKIANRLDNGEREAARMTNSDAQTLAIAKRELTPLNLPILEAVRAVVAATKILPEGTPLLTAVRFYAAHHTPQNRRKLVPDAIREFLSAKREDGLSSAYLKTLRALLDPNEGNDGKRRRKSFGDAFQTYIDTVTTADMDAWIRARGVGIRRRRNIMLMLRTLFNFARDTGGYLPKNQPTEADGLTLPKKRTGEIGIFTPAEMRALLAGSEDHPANDEYRLWLVIGAFAGLRTAEMLRLEWEKHIQIKKNQIVISGDIAKTAGRRIIRMHGNLKAWLMDYASRTGQIFEARADERVHRYASRLGIPWKSNALRHSFISYAVGQTKDIPAVSYEAGNSPAIIKTNYMELVGAREAREWFAIMPPKQPGNVIRMKARAA